MCYASFDVEKPIKIFKFKMRKGAGESEILFKNFSNAIKDLYIDRQPAMF